MSIDSIGGGDPSLAARRRILEEESAKELSRIEAKKRQAIADAEEAKRKTLQDIYQNQENEIQGRQQDADIQVERAKGSAESRVRDFEQDATRMTEEAKKQFQAKAALLQKNSKELESQRQFMLKQHADTMQRLKTEREQARFESASRFEREAMQSHARQQKRLDEMQILDEHELEAQRAQFQDQKWRAMNDADRTLRSLADQRDENAASIQRQIDFYRRSGDQELQSARDNLANNAAHQQTEFENRMSLLNRENRTAMNHAHIEGGRKLAETQEVYLKQAEDLRKDGEKRAHATEVQAKARADSIESQAKAQEYMALRGFEYKRNLLEERRNQLLTQQNERNHLLREHLAADYKDQMQAQSEQKNKTLVSQNEQYQNELKAQAKRGEAQLGDLIKSSAITLASHEARAADEFYRIHSINPRIEETATEVIVTIKAPEHEQDNLRLTQQSGNLTISGTRRSENKVKSEDGRSTTTNSYQSYSETLPLRARVDMKRLTRSYADGNLTFRMPKI